MCVYKRESDSINEDGWNGARQEMARRHEGRLILRQILTLVYNSQLVFSENESALLRYTNQ